MSNRPRVVVTGLGILCPTGNDLIPAWQNICAGKSGIDKITLIENNVLSGLSSQIAGEVKNFKARDYLDVKDARRYDRFIHFALVAAQQAITNSGLDLDKIDLTRVGVNIGSGIGGLPEIERTAKVFFSGGQKKISPFFIPATIGNMAAGLVSINLGLQGPSYGCVSACATANHSIGDAFRAIILGDAEVMLAGGSEATITGLAVGGFSAMKALSTRNDDPTSASRPWAKGRDGFVIGEGAGVLVLEKYEHAKARSARIYCELVGYGATSDASHITAPLEDGSGAARCINMAMKDAKLNPENVFYVNAHGTSTLLGDLAETLAVKKALGAHAKNIVMSSTKSMTGHLLGAAAGIEAVFSAMSLYDGVIPPTINLDKTGGADDGCDLDYCAKDAREVDKNKYKIAISNSFGFGGTNSTIILRKI